jgi:monoamine oxidase
MPYRTGRRGFLKNATFAVAALSARPLTSRPTLRVQTRRPSAVIVVGAGVAGLVAARRLKDAGMRVIVIEARNEPGGRIRTIRAPFDDGLHAEAGAARISELHSFVLHCAGELGLALDPFAPSEAAALAVVGGTRGHVGSRDSLAGLPLDLRADERGLTPAALLRRYLGDQLSDLEDPEPGPATYARWKDYDRLTWPDWLRARGASDDAIRLMTLGSDSRDLSALYVLRQFAMHSDGQRFYKIRGGMDRIPRIMAEQLADIVRYSAAVVRIEHGPDGVRVGYGQNGRIETVSGDRLVLAIPFSTLRRIEIDPPFSKAKAEAIRDLPYYSATRFLLQSRRRFWSMSGLSGAARTERFTETWDASFGEDGTRGILSVTLGEGIDSDRRDPKLDRTIKAGLDLAAEAFPGIVDEFEKGTVHSWRDESWSRGAFAAFRPGQMSVMMPDMARPEGRVHFAGEHTSPWMGWVEGALRSGERVAQEILER